MKNSYGFSIWMRRHLENISSQAAQQNADMAAGIQARSWFPVSIAAQGLA